MNDEQIKAEAKRRFDNMSYEEKIDFMKLSPDERKLLDKVEKIGYKQLEYDQQRKFRRMILDQGFKSIPGGIINGGIVSIANKELHISKDDLRKGGQKNPFKAHLFKDIIIALVLNIGAGALALTGLSPVAIAVEATTGVIAMDFARQLGNFFRWKKIQKQYMSGEMDEKEINGEILNSIITEGNKRWYR